MNRLLPALLLLIAFPAAASAAPPCPGDPPEVRTLLQGAGRLESVRVDPQGRLFFTDEGHLLRLDAPGAQPRVLADIQSPGGIAFDERGMVIVGYGNTFANGSTGDQNPRAGLLRVHPETGATEVFATGLSMGNGVDRDADGNYYASNDFGSNVDRIRDGRTEHGWAKVESGNGLVVDTANRNLYVAQTFRPAAVQRVTLTDPPRVTEYVRAEASDMQAGLDGMARDNEDNLFVAANGAGEVWKIDRRPSICLLLDGLRGFPDGPSAVSTGSPQGPFPAGNLYVVTFNGLLLELVNVASTAPPPAAARPRIRLRVRPRVTRAGRRTRFRFRATAVRGGSRRPVARARIRFAGKRARTGRRGRARIVATFSRPGRRRAMARRPGLRRGAATVRVRRARR